jgi:hypothetical protein
MQVFLKAGVTDAQLPGTQFFVQQLPAIIRKSAVCQLYPLFKHWTVGFSQTKSL